jgi:hypothetical protein
MLAAVSMSPMVRARLRDSAEQERAGLRLASPSNCRISATA